MLPLVAAKAIWRDKGRTIGVVLTVALIVILIALPSAIKKSAINNPLNYIQRAGVDVFVLSAGLNDYASSSIVSQRDLDRVRRLPSVSQAQGTVLSFARVQTDAHSQSVVVQSFDPSAGYGGPWQLTAGRTVKANGEIVLDSALAKRLAVGVSDKVQLGSVRYRVVGLSAGTSSIGKQLVFITTADGTSDLTQKGVFTHILVKTSNPELAVHQISELNLSAFDRSEFYRLNKAYWSQQIAPTLDLVVLAVVLPGFLLLMVLFYASIRQRIRELTIRLAQGVSLGYLWGQEILMIFTLALVGLALGLVTARGAVWLANTGSPGLDATVDSGVVWLTTVIVVLAGTLAVRTAPDGAAREGRRKSVIRSKPDAAK